MKELIVILLTTLTAACGCWFLKNTIARVVAGVVWLIVCSFCVVLMIIKEQLRLKECPKCKKVISIQPGQVDPRFSEHPRLHRIEEWCSCSSKKD